MRCNRFIALLLLVAALSAVTARAVPTAAQIKAAFNQFDPAKNDAVNHVEWERGSYVIFRTADKNKDGFLTPDEIVTGPVAQETFDLADTNHDGKLTIDEFMEMRRAIFSAADINRDDYITREEFELNQLFGEFGWNDRNHNGRIDPSELKDALNQAFNGLDTDKDGALTPAETAYMTEVQFKKFDTDHDGKLSAKEFVSGYLAIFGLD